ncbi:hypothetical protein RF657_03780 [Yersinia rochesterensis]|uniref:hypothetical protein n=1 Tax=Yersinia rochesterensis TaxID=1604335 RepID=UPI0028536F5E|nr:hypothetical protein [Yersinia rochesterensis]MDR5017526.1 hypothetical protein [Yersinia rochesterensis]
MREILLLFAVPSGSRWLYRASASRFLLQRAFHGRPARSLGPPSLSVIFLIALNVKRENQNHYFDLDVKSTFEPPSDEWSKGNPPWTADLGVTRRDPRKAAPPAK